MVQITVVQFVFLENKLVVMQATVFRSEYGTGEPFVLINPNCFGGSSLV